MKTPEPLNRETPVFLTPRRIAMVSFGFALSGTALWYVFRNLDFNELFRSAGRIRAWPLLGALVLYWAGAIPVRAALIRFLLKPQGTAPLGKIYRYICIGFLANNLLPLRIGEVVRVGGIARASGLGLATVAGAAAVERMLDMVMATLLCVMAVQVAPLPESVQITVVVLGSLLVVAFALLSFLARRDLRERPEKDGLALGVRLWNLLVRVASGFGALSSSGGSLRAVGLSALVWLCVIGVMLLRLVAFDLPASLPVVLVLLSGLALSVSLPSAPAYLGVYHAAAAASLILFGVDDTVAVGFAVFCHIVDIVPACLLGAVSMLLEGVGWTDLKRTTIP